MTSDFNFREPSSVKELLHTLKEIILSQDSDVREVVAEVLEFTNSFLFEENGEFVYGLTMTLDSVVFHSPLLGLEPPMHPDLTETLMRDFSGFPVENGSLEIKMETLQNRPLFVERFTRVVSQIASLRKH